MKLRMTLEDVAQEMRRMGCPIGKIALADGMISGVFPFGKVLSIGPTGRRSFLILRADFNTWAEKNLGGGTHEGHEVSR